MAIIRTIPFTERQPDPSLMAKLTKLDEKRAAAAFAKYVAAEKLKIKHLQKAV